MSAKSEIGDAVIRRVAITMVNNSVTRIYAVPHFINDAVHFIFLLIDTDVAIPTFIFPTNFASRLSNSQFFIGRTDEFLKEFKSVGELFRCSTPFLSHNHYLLLLRLV